MKKHTLSFAIATAFALSACSGSETPAPTSQPAPAPASEPAAPESRSAPAAPKYAAHEISGRFIGVLPCASCPGIDTALTLIGDGRYILEETYLEQDGGPITSQGTWTIRDALVLLTPDGASAPENHYAIDSKNRLTQVSADGTRSEILELNYTLERTADLM